MTTEKKLKAVIAEDHEIYREGLASLLTELAEEAVLFKAETYPQALCYLQKHCDTDLILLDLKLPGTKDLDGLNELRQAFPTLTIIVVSSLDFQFGVNEVMKLGANGFIAKTTPTQDMKAAIESALNGELVVKTESLTAETPFLSERQTQTLHLLAQGLSNRDIAQKLNISIATVKEHVSALFKRLGVSNRAGAISKAQQMGLLLRY